MKKTDLRIGNTIQRQDLCNDSWITAKILSIYKCNDTKSMKVSTFLGGEDITVNTEIKNIIGIPIDEKLLKIIEDIDYDGMSIYRLHSAGFSIDFRVKYDRIEKYIVTNQILSDNAEFRINISYLHELQNLFFSLTRKELIFNLIAYNR